MTKLLLIINYNKSFKVIITLNLRKLLIYGVSGVRLRLVLIKLFLHADRRTLPSSHMFCKSLTQQRQSPKFRQLMQKTRLEISACGELRVRWYPRAGWEVRVACSQGPYM